MDTIDGAVNSASGLTVELLIEAVRRQEHPHSTEAKKTILMGLKKIDAQNRKIGRPTTYEATCRKMFNLSISSGENPGQEENMKDPNAEAIKDVSCLINKTHYNLSLIGGVDASHENIGYMPDKIDRGIGPMFESEFDGGSEYSLGGSATVIISGSDQEKAYALTFIQFYDGPHGHRRYKGCFCWLEAPSSSLSTSAQHNLWAVITTAENCMCNAEEPENNWDEISEEAVPEWAKEHLKKWLPITQSLVGQGHF